MYFLLATHLYFSSWQGRLSLPCMFFRLYHEESQESRRWNGDAYYVGARTCSINRHSTALALPTYPPCTAGFSSSRPDHALCGKSHDHAEANRPGEITPRQSDTICMAARALIEAGIPCFRIACSPLPKINGTVRRRAP